MNPSVGCVYCPVSDVDMKIILKHAGTADSQAGKIFFVSFSLLFLFSFFYRFINLWFCQDFNLRFSVKDNHLSS